jgi:serine/threonine protein kinase
VCFHCLLTAIADNKIYVVKEVNIRGMSKNELDEAIKECHVLASLSHPHIIGYMDSFVDDETSKLNIVMEFAEHGTLDDYFKVEFINLASDLLETTWESIN